MKLFRKRDEERGQELLTGMATARDEFHHAIEEYRRELAETHETVRELVKEKEADK